MVFSCLPIGGVELVTQSEEIYKTAPSRFDLRPSGSAPTSKDVEYIKSGVPSLNTGSSTLRVFTFAELDKATENFDKSTKIGEGGFGSVHSGTIKSLDPPFDDIRVAVKRGKKGQKGQRQWQTEVDILGAIQHQNLVKLIGYCYEEHGNESNWLLVYEYMAKRSLDDHLSGKSKEHLPWPTRLKIARDAAIGLNYLHEGMGPKIKIIFRDFKPSNVLLDEEWNAKLSDFGLVREGPPDGRSHVSTSVVGTKGYAAPEYVQTGRLSFKMDVWSYGVFLEELISGRPPVTQKNSEVEPQGMRWLCCYSGAGVGAGTGRSKPIVDSRLGDKYSPRSMEMITSTAEKCLATDPKLRPSMSEVLKVVNQAIALENQRQTP